jgi:hypothetical protein
MEIENLGKPSTLQDLLSALGEVSEWTQELTLHEGNLFYEHGKYENNPIIIDLSKTVETQSQEVINQLIEILTN